MNRLRCLIIGLIVAILLVQHRDDLVGWNNEEIDMVNTDKTKRYTAISLLYFQKAIKDALAQGLILDADLRTLFGISEFKGMSYKPWSGECVIFGIRDENMPSIDINDFAIALKEIFTNNVPGVTIDPEDPKDFGGSQRIKFFGEYTGQSKFGFTLFDCDFHLKKLAANIVPTGVNDFKSYYELALLEYKQQLSKCNGDLSPHEDANRYWFYPTKPKFSKNGSAVTIKDFGVQVLTEKQLINKAKGKIASLKGQKGKHADAFSKSFSNRYDEIAAVHPKYKKLKSLFNLVTISKLMLYEQIDLRNIDYFLREYTVLKYEAPDTVDGISLTRNLSHPINNFPYSERCVHSLHFSGGVSMEVLINKSNFFRDKSRILPKLQRQIYSYRPSPDAISWEFEFYELL